MTEMPTSSLPLVQDPELPPRPPRGQVRVVAAQVEPRLADTAANVERSVAVLRQARGLGATLVVFPECSLSGYCFADLDEALRLAPAVDDPSWRVLQQACAELELHTVVGAIERDGDLLRNTAALVGPTGRVATYHKTHLPHLGIDRWVTAGAGPFEVAQAGDLRLGLLVCYDASFPEAARLLTLAGADLLVLPTNWPAEAIVKADWLPNARAYENVVWFAAVNRVGEERGFRFHGRSRICDPTGVTVVQGPDEVEALLVADVDPARARIKRIERRGSDYSVDRIADRRTDLYELRIPEGGSEAAS